MNHKVMFVHDNKWRVLELPKNKYPTKHDAAKMVKSLFDNTFIRSIT